MTTSLQIGAARAIARDARPLAGNDADFDEILGAARTARFVLIGEASHGTHDFYRMRAEITKRLIRECGYTAIAVEADWPDAYRVNRYVRGMAGDTGASSALAGFLRFPQWMWRNADVLDFVGWLRSHNDALESANRVGFYGLDLYSLHASIHAVLEYLRVVDPEAAARAQERYSCFDHFGGDPQQYGYAATRDVFQSCEDDAVNQLIELRRGAAAYAKHDGRIDGDAVFAAEQNARLVVRAEQYYRSMFRGRVDSWNLRDTHMAETLQSLAIHLNRPALPAKLVVWAHNSHLGDARATELGHGGELNLGQLARERFGPESLLIGFSTYEGTVTAATNWDAPAERKRVRQALPGSMERLFHDTELPKFSLDLRGSTDSVDVLRDEWLQRAIGVIYRPATERMSHYFHARPADQFDFLIHLDLTRALEPLEHSPAWARGEPDIPETYPSAL